MATEYQAHHRDRHAVLHLGLLGRVVDGVLEGDGPLGALLLTDVPVIGIRITKRDQVDLVRPDEMHVQPWHPRPVLAVPEGATRLAEKQIEDRGFRGAIRAESIAVLRPTTAH